MQTGRQEASKHSRTFLKHSKRTKTIGRRNKSKERVLSLALLGLLAHVRAEGLVCPVQAIQQTKQPCACSVVEGQQQR